MDAASNHQENNIPEQPNIVPTKSERLDDERTVKRLSVRVSKLDPGRESRVDAHARRVAVAMSWDASVA